MKQVLIMSLLAVSTVLPAQQIELKVWPDGAPNTNDITTPEWEMEPNRITDVSEPTLTVYPAENPNGLAVVACPGGGYVRLSMDHEGHDLAQWFNAQGITYAVLKYRMPNGHSDVPLSDALQAIRLMRAHADEWHFTQVGIMGASAGGHLATTAATHYTSDSRPDFQILFYPVVSMHTENTHRGSFEHLLGPDPSEELLERYSNEQQVTEDTPPAFIMHSSDDGSVPVTNSVNYYLALVAHHVPAALHIYPVGGHGWGFRDNFTYKREWTGELEKWLREEIRK